jgi:hypothetical protein
VIDFTFIWTILVTGIVIVTCGLAFLFLRAGTRRGGSAMQTETTAIRRMLIEWFLYMGIFVVLASVLRAVLKLMCSHC